MFVFSAGDRAHCTAHDQTADTGISMRGDGGSRDGNTQPDTGGRTALLKPTVEARASEISGEGLQPSSSVGVVPEMVRDSPCLKRQDDETFISGSRTEEVSHLRKDSNPSTTTAPASKVAHTNSASYDDLESAESVVADRDGLAPMSISADLQAVDHQATISTLKR